jgi:hypothetical protein
MDYLLSNNYTTEAGLWTDGNRSTLQHFAIHERRIMECGGTKFLPIVKKQVTKVGLANARGILQHCLEHRSQLAGRF